MIPLDGSKHSLHVPKPSSLIHPPISISPTGIVLIVQRLYIPLYSSTVKGLVPAAASPEIARLLTLFIDRNLALHLFFLRPCKTGSKHQHPNPRIHANKHAHHPRPSIPPQHNHIHHPNPKLPQHRSICHRFPFLRNSSGYPHSSQRPFINARSRNALYRPYPFPPPPP